MKRRSFLKFAGGVASSYYLAAAGKLRAADSKVKTPDEKPTELPKRILGRTGRKISIIGFPGLALTRGNQDECTKVIHNAFEQGINYFDVAPTYGDGDAEIKMGIGLQGLDRDKIFLSCKTQKRDKDGARQELERSLSRLKTDYFDLYQLHAITRAEDVQQALGPGGAMETFVKAKEEGKVKHFGFSAHTTKAATMALNGFSFDTAMFPVNFVEYFKFGFAKEVMALAKEQGVAVIAIKAMAGGAWPNRNERTRNHWYRTLEDDEEIAMALRFTLSQETVVTAIPPGFLDLFAKAIPAGNSYRQITEAETQKLQKMADSAQSVFQRWQNQFATDIATYKPLYADCPHECCHYSHA
jgi:aryl-alcohol dehydrogenase-like predicted oxidoreductase